MIKKINNNQNGVIHHLLLFILIGLVLAGVSFAGWRVWDNKQEASAATSGSLLVSRFGLNIYGCRKNIGSNYYVRISAVGSFHLGSSERYLDATGYNKTSLTGSSKTLNSIQRIIDLKKSRKVEFSVPNNYNTYAHFDIKLKPTADPMAGGTKIISGYRVALLKVCPN